MLPTCQQCGACCFSRLDAYVEVSGDDYERLGDLAESMTRWSDNRCYLRITRGRCSALHIDAELQQFHCGIYERRPAICRSLERGSPECLAERAAKARRASSAMRRASAR